MNNRLANMPQILGLLLAICLSPCLQAVENRISMSLEQVELHKVMNMLSKQQRLNIFLADGVNGKVSINLFDMKVDDAIRSISEAAGYALERRNGSYFIVKREDVGKYQQSGITEIRAFKVQYSQPDQVEGILKKHLSSFGKITTLADRSMLIVEDQPEFLLKMESLLSEIDREPKQILIEAKILEVTLTDNETFGLDWAKLFSRDDGDGSFGVRGLVNNASPGLFLEYLSPNVDVALNALKERGRLRTLSTPKLLAMEDRTAETAVGTRLGFRVTTTINQVTSESIEFLETGIILRVTPSVDRQGMILLDIHPEVSDGSVSDDGIPSKTATQLSTRMLVPDGQTVFLGGLIKRNTNESREGVPVLGDIPGVGALFSNRSKNQTATEIVVLITPKLIDFQDSRWKDAVVGRVQEIEQLLSEQHQQTQKRTEQLMNGLPQRETEQQSQHTWEDPDDALWFLTH